MNLKLQSKLEQLGLSVAEAQIYLAVLRSGPLTASDLANETGIARTSVYPALCSLADKGLVESGVGRGSKFTAVSPEDALASLIVRDERALSERKRIADELTETLAPLAADIESELDATVQVVRTQQVIAERFYRLQLEAEREVLMFVKAPILMAGRGNPAEQKALQRGVRYRCLYERAVLDDPKIGPYLASWIAGGEEARLYGGELPYKVVLIDDEIVLVILVRQSGQSSALIVKHEPFAKSIAMLFDSLWKESQPLAAESYVKAYSLKTVSETANRSTSRAPAGKSHSAGTADAAHRRA